MLKFRVDRRVSQHGFSGPSGPAVSLIQLEAPPSIVPYIQYCHSTMNGKENTAADKIIHSSAYMVSDLSPETQPYVRTSRTPKKIATFGKRSNSMRRNPKAEVTRRGWLYKQTSSGVKKWNKRWFVLTDRCLFYYKDEKEDTILGSLPLLSFKIAGVEPSDHITRKFAIKVWMEEVDRDEHLTGTAGFCMQAEHAGTRTYYFSADSHEEQEDWIRAMMEAAEVNVHPTQRTNSDITVDVKKKMVAKTSSPQQHSQTHIKTHSELSTKTKMNGENSLEIPLPSTSCLEQETQMNNGRQFEGEGHGQNHDLIGHPNGWGSYGSIPHNSNGKSSVFRSNSGYRSSQGHIESNVVQLHDTRGFVPRTPPERVAQRKSSMAHLQQWVNQRRGMASHEDINSSSRYYPVNREVSFDYYGYPGGPHYVEEYPLYPPGIRPDSISSVSAVGGYDRRWTLEEKRRSLRDVQCEFYGPPLPRDSWVPQYYSGMETSMRRLSLQPRSRSVPRSPSASSGGPYSPMPPNFASPSRSPSVNFDRFSGKMRDDVIYADQSVYSLRRALSSSKMPPFHNIYSRELHPTLKLNEIETSKLLGRLCEQNQILKNHEAVVHRLRMDKDNLEDALVATHQEMELYHNQPLAIEKLQLKKETLQNQLINIRGELSQASSALTTTHMEFEALEDEANAIHGDLWEQLNTGGQSELVHKHIQKEFWRVQDVLEGLHKSNLSRVASGASGSFSTNSPASPLSSLSLTSPLSPFSPVVGSQASPTKQHGLEENVPPRPPLPKSYYPLETSPSYPPSIPPMPIDSTTCPLSLGSDDGFHNGEGTRKKVEQNNVYDVQEQFQDRQPIANKVGIVPPRTKSPTDMSHSNSTGIFWRNRTGISRERPKSAVLPAEVKSKMSIEEQNERIRRNQSSSVRDRRRSVNLSSSQSPANYKVVRRRLTAHEIDIKDLEAAVRGQGQESPREEIARLRQLQIEPQNYNLDINQELVAGKVDLDVEDDTPLSPEEQKEKQKKLERIKTLIAKSNLQNLVPPLDGPAEGGVPGSCQKQLQEQEKRIEISCALAAEASRRSRILSASCAPSAPSSSTSLAPPPSSVDFPKSAHIMKV